MKKEVIKFVDIIVAIFIIGTSLVSFIAAWAMFGFIIGCIVGVVACILTSIPCLFWILISAVHDRLLEQTELLKKLVDK